jgi:osmotically-inducible protein OsmY
MMNGDAELRKHVEDELAWESSLDEAAIGVNVADAVVTLTGHVRNYAEKLAAERAVMRVRGVHGLVSKLEVTVPHAHRRTDEDLAQAAVNALTWNAQLPDTITVRVDHGFVTLGGSVELPYQRITAEREVSRLTGVKGVVNDIHLKPSRPVTAEIKAGIEAALKRSAEVEARRIAVHLHGSTVVLTGTVASWQERHAAERAAWAGPGVTRVENDIRINSSMASPNDGPL